MCEIYSLLACSLELFPLPFNIELEKKAETAMNDNDDYDSAPDDDINNDEW